MPLIIRKQEDETWRDAALRCARPYGLEWEVGEFYDRFVREGRTEGEAAFDACCEWDVCDLTEEPQP